MAARTKLLLSLLLFIVAISCNAIMDTTSHHPDNVLCRTSQDAAAKRWLNCNGDSWLNKYQERNPKLGRRTVDVAGVHLPYPVQITDAFHFFKTLMIFAFCAIFALYLMALKPLTRSAKLNWFLYWALTGCLWNAVFNLWYDVLLK